MNGPEVHVAFGDELGQTRWNTLKRSWFQTTATRKLLVSISSLVWIRPYQGPPISRDVTDSRLSHLYECARARVCLCMCEKESPSLRAQPLFSVWIDDAAGSLSIYLAGCYLVENTQSCVCLTSQGNTCPQTGLWVGWPLILKAFNLS